MQAIEFGEKTQGLWLLRR